MSNHGFPRMVANIRTSFGPRETRWSQSTRGFKETARNESGSAVSVNISWADDLLTSKHVYFIFYRLDLSEVTNLKIACTRTPSALGSEVALTNPFPSIRSNHMCMFTLFVNLKLMLEPAGVVPAFKLAATRAFRFCIEALLSTLSGKSHLSKSRS